MSKTRSCAATDVGLQRSNNEDSYIDAPDQGLWIVADGMGGHAAGEVASSIASDVILEKINNGGALSSAIQASHKAIIQAAANGQGGKGMGSTVVALLSRSDEYEIAWVGDSRAYLWTDGNLCQLERLTTDHSYVQLLYESGLITEKEMDTHPEKNIITQCLGSTELDEVTVSTRKGKWPDNSTILLCSDGLTDAVSDVKIANIIKRSDSLDRLKTELVQEALSSGGKDNITLVLIQKIQDKNTSVLTKLRALFSRVF